MLTIQNIKRIEGQVVTIKGADWKIIGATDMADGKPQYHFYLTHLGNFRTIYLDRIINTPKNSGNVENKDYYKLHTSQTAKYITTEELRSVGSTLFWLEQVCG
jgi:hypothetical protein